MFKILTISMVLTSCVIRPKVEERQLGTSLGTVEVSPRSITRFIDGDVTCYVWSGGPSGDAGISCVGAGAK